MGAGRSRLVRILIVAVPLAAVAAGYAAYQRYEARTQLRTAEEALVRRDWKAARETLKDATARWPDRADVFVLAARAERRLENLGEAKKLLDTAERLEGGETPAIQVERALLRVHDGEVAAVEAFLLERARGGDPDAVEIYDILSAAYELTYRTAECQRCLDEFLKARPDDYDALVRRGRAAKTMGWYEDAVGYFDRALAVRPDADHVRLMAAETQGAFGQFARARDNFERLRVKRPHDPGLAFGVALCAAGTGRHDEAKTLFDQLLTSNPDNWPVLVERGKLAVQLDRPQDGLADLKRADALAPPDVAPTHLVACLLALGRADEAKPYQEKVDRIAADRKRTADLGDRVRERPDDPEPRYELGVALLRLGKQREAVHWLRTAVEKNPGHRKAHEALADFFRSVNAAEQAEHHRRALEKLPAS